MLSDQMLFIFFSISNPFLPYRPQLRWSAQFCVWLKDISLPDNCFSFTAVQPYLSIVKYLNEIQLEDIHQPMASNSERYTLVSLILKVVKYFLAQKYFSSSPALRPSGPAVRDLSWQLQRWSDVHISAKHLPPCQPVCTTTTPQGSTECMDLRST